MDQEQIKNLIKEQISSQCKDLAACKEAAQKLTKPTSKEEYIQVFSQLTELKGKIEYHKGALVALKTILDEIK